MTTIPAVSQETITRALEAANLPALMMSIIHMTGDTSILDGSIRPGPAGMLDVSGGLSESEQTRIRALAAEAIARFCDAATPAKRLPRATVERMMAFSAGEAIPEKLSELCLEELALHEEDPRRRDISTAGRANAERDAFSVIIIGGGMSGLLLAYRLAQQGIEFQVLEKNDGVGGTWFENQYPGCRVDIASHAYSYSFDDRKWDSYFGEHDELRANFTRLAEEHDLIPHMEFGAEVSRAEYDDAAKKWTVEYSQGGKAHSRTASVVVSAVGQLNRPRIPDVEGIDEFTGPQVHTAQWDSNIDLAGKRVAVVGTGASAFQLVPELAKQCSEVKVFQRKPPWMFPNAGYHEKVSPEHQWCLTHLPGYGRWYRFLSIWSMLDKADDRLGIDPAWDDGGRSCSAGNRAFRDDLETYVRSQVSDPDLLEAVIPDYPPFGTRTLQDNGSWLAALQKDHVELVAEGVGQTTPSGVRTASGRDFEVDAIVWATGFHADRFLWPMAVVGSEGVRLEDEWREIPKAYLGITIPKFPNLFCLYGPNTNVAHTGNCIMVAELQVTYIMSCIGLILDEDLAAIDCRAEVADAYEARLEEALSTKAWSAQGVESFYRKGHSGRVVSNMPWNMSEYRELTNVVQPSDFRLDRRESGS